MARAPYEVRFNVGNVQPSTDVSCTLNLRPEFLARLGPNSGVQVFAQMLEGGSDGEFLDSFELFASTVDAPRGTVSATLPAQAFTDSRTADGTYEAVVVVGATPTVSLASPTAAPSSSSSLAAATDACGGLSLGQPLGGALVVQSKFDPAARSRGHYGTDYVAATGTKVLSMASGVVDEVGFKLEKHERRDGRTGTFYTGWGRYVIVRHAGGQKTVYAHLEMDGVVVSRGQTVSQGQVLGTSDSTGGSTGPHLHVEYAPNGDVGKQGNKLVRTKVDPDACIARDRCAFNPSAPGFLRDCDTCVYQSSPYGETDPGDTACCFECCTGNLLSISSKRSEFCADTRRFLAKICADEIAAGRMRC